jgi:uncharacterized protein (TIGR02599 family)
MVALKHHTSIRRRAGFSLVELMVSMTILSFIMVMSAKIIGQMQQTWTSSSARLEQFREARNAFEIITQGLRQATLNTYLTYEYNTGATPTVPDSKEEAPKRYIRHSELQFVTGPAASLLTGQSEDHLRTHGVFFQALMGTSDRPGYEGLQRLLCGRGYYILHSSDEAYRPKHVRDVRARYRLWEYRPAAEMNEVYSVTPGEWFAKAAEEVIQPGETLDMPSHSRPLAENIIALIVSPQVTAEDAAQRGAPATWLAPEYAFDSTRIFSPSSTNQQGTQHLLPPTVLVTLVAIDEASARRLAEDNPESAPDLIPDGAFKACANFEPDLRALETALLERKLNYRIFSSSVPMRNSKWNQMHH